MYLQAEYPLEQYQLDSLPVLSLENRTERTLLKKREKKDILIAPNKIILKILFILDATQFNSVKYLPTECKCNSYFTEKLIASLF